MTDPSPKQAPPRESLPLVHLTTVRHGGTKVWEASCLCPWTGTYETKRKAIEAAEHHWLRSQEVN